MAKTPLDKWFDTTDIEDAVKSAYGDRVAAFYRQIEDEIAESEAWNALAEMQDIMSKGETEPDEIIAHIEDVTGYEFSE